MKRRTAATAIACLVVIAVIIASYVEHTNFGIRNVFLASERADALRMEHLERKLKHAVEQGSSIAHCGVPEIMDGIMQFPVLYRDVYPDSNMHNIFLMETSSVTDIPQENFCAIESYCLMNPSSAVWFFLAPRPLALHSLEDFAALRTVHHNLCVAYLNFTLLLQDTPLLSLYQSKNFWNTTYLPNNLSNLARLAVVYKSGGYYSDLDIMALRAVDRLRNFVGKQNKGYPAVLNNAVFHFEKKHQLLLKLMEYMTENYEGNRWGANGPTALTAVVTDAGCDQTPLAIKHRRSSELVQDCEIDIRGMNRSVNLNKETGRNKSARLGQHVASEHTLLCDLVVLNQTVFYPVNWRQAKSLFEKTTEGEKDVPVHEIFPESCGVHLSNKITKDLEFEHGSAVMKLARSSCPITMLTHPVWGEFYK